MKNMIRNTSLLVNVLLLLLLVVSIGWAWRHNATATLGGSAVRDYRRDSDTYEAFINGKLVAQKLVGRQFPGMLLKDLRNRDVSTDFSERSGALVLLFKPQACQPCLIMQLKSLQHIFDARRDTAGMSVIAIGAAPPGEIKRFTRAFGLTYPVISDTAGMIFDHTLAKATLVVFLVNEANTIIDAHIPTPGRREFSLLFYNELRVKQFVAASLVQEKSTFGLGDVRFVDVIRNDFDATNEHVRHVLY